MNKKYVDIDYILGQISEAQASLEMDDDKLWGRNKPYFNGLAWVNALILEAPEVATAEVRNGKWIRTQRAAKDHNGYYFWNAPLETVFVCSECGRVEIVEEPYCNCGAKMDGGKK